MRKMKHGLKLPHFKGKKMKIHSGISSCNIPKHQREEANEKQNVNARYCSIQNFRLKNDSNHRCKTMKTTRS